MQENILRLLGDAGIRVVFDRRGYRPSLSLDGFEAKLLKPQNIVEMLHAGSRDIGFAGADWVAELGVELVEDLRGWQHAEVELVPGRGGLVVRHGFVTGHNTAGRTLAKLGRSVIVGHDHSKASAYKLDYPERLLLQAHVAGTMSLCDETWPHFAVEPDWHQGLVTATIWHLAEPVDAVLARALARSIPAALREAGARVLASYASETAPNTFPALPVREGEYVLVWLCAFADAHHHAAHLARLRHQPDWSDAMRVLRLVRAPEILRLAPTPRSSLRG